ncbi:hypothetical protein HY251_05470 [bacterium]|nr:hypothetical protein [bacterium]
MDTAPTGHTLRLLELPAKAREWVRVLLSVIMKYRELVGLGKLTEDLLALAHDLRDFQGILEDRERTQLVAVTRAAALPRAGTLRLLRGLERLGVACETIVVNGATPRGCSRCTRAASREERELRSLESALRRARRENAILVAPAVAPPPRGVKMLRSFGRTWKRS